jgi:hypothetical protein
MLSTSYAAFFYFPSDGENIYHRIQSKVSLFSHILGSFLLQFQPKPHINMLQFFLVLGVS